MNSDNMNSDNMNSDNMNSEKEQIPFTMEPMTFPGFPPNQVMIQEYVHKGKEKNTIQNAIEACKKMGGGTVVIPEGEWLTGPIHLSDHIHLHLEKGAIVRFSKVFSDYLPVVFTRWEGMECYNYSPLIYAKDCENIAITGEGHFIGGGEAWWHWKHLQQPAANELCYAQSNGVPVENRIYGTEEAALRPSFIQFIHCKKIQLQDFTMEDGPQWMILPVYCQQVLIKGLNVISRGHNTDGLNPDSCNNVWIEGCQFETGDDCIAINSGMNEDGWRVNRPCQNIVIQNCTMKGGHGGIVIGSGLSGGVQNVYAFACKIHGTNQGIRLKSMRGRGGYVKNIWFEDIEINDVLEEAIQITMFYKYSTVIPKTTTPSRFSEIYMKRIYGSGAAIILEVCGLPELSIKNIVLEDIELSGETALLCDYVEDMKLRNVHLKTRKGGM